MRCKKRNHSLGNSSLDFNTASKDRHLLGLCYCKYPQRLIITQVYPQSAPVAIPRISPSNKLVVSLSVPRTYHKRLRISLFKLVAHIDRFPSVDTKQGVGEMKEFRPKVTSLKYYTPSQMRVYLASKPRIQVTFLNPTSLQIQRGEACFSPQH